jgi:shikimate kinase
MSAAAPPERLALVGLTGTGKTSAARAVAERLGLDWVDTDDEIERRAGSTVRDLWAAEGEAAFRDREAAVLVDVLTASDGPRVIACGGGVVLRPGNRAALRAGHVHVVRLVGDPEVVAARLAGAGQPHRPILDGDAAATLSRLAGEREAFYAEVADATVRVDDADAATVAERVLASFRAFCAARGATLQPPA